jgi:hypothetical protein
VRSLETSQACNVASNGIQLGFRDAVYPNLADVDVIANMSNSEGSMGLAQTATASASTEQAAIKFNGNKFSSWRDASDEYTRVANRGTSKVEGLCFNSRAEVPKSDDFGLLLSVVEGSAAD